MIRNYTNTQYSVNPNAYAYDQEVNRRDKIKNKLLHDMGTNVNIKLNRGNEKALPFSKDMENLIGQMVGDGIDFEPRRRNLMSSSSSGGRTITGGTKKKKKTMKERALGMFRRNPQVQPSSNDGGSSSGSSSVYNYITGTDII